jgi:hypothetical protein
MRRAAVTVIALVVLIAVVWTLLYHYSLTDAGLPSPVQSFHGVLKCAIVPILGLCWYIISPSHPTQIICYVIFSTIGDAFLIHRMFAVYAVGGFFFSLSHCLLLRHFRIKWTRVPIPAYVFMIVNLAVVGVQLVPEFRHPSGQIVGFVLYAICLELGACSSVARVHRYAVREPSFFLCVLGYFSYLVSDSMLLHGKLRRAAGSRGLAAPVMATYIAAQALILFATAIDPEAKVKAND